MSCDPTELGALCHECPLGPNGIFRPDFFQPVLPEHRDTAKTLVITNSPTMDDEREGRPLQGAAGQELTAALHRSDLRRRDVSITPVILCRLPGAAAGAWKRLKRKLDAANKKRAEMGAHAILPPTHYCRPRLLNDLAKYKHVMPLGKIATQAVTGSDASIERTRGDLIFVNAEMRRTFTKDEAVWKVVPAMHPATTLRSPAWRPVLVADIQKAERWFNGRLRWTKPETLWRPTPQELREWFARDEPFWAYDLETDGIHTNICNVRTLAVATPDSTGQVSQAVGLSFLSTDGYTRFYPPDVEAEIYDILRDAFSDGRVWVGHNAGYFDRKVVETWLGVTPHPIVDTLFGARFRSPDLPKGLKTVGSILTDVERWETTEKGTKIATGSEDDDELLKYNIIDAVVNVRITRPLLTDADEVGAFRAISEDIRPPGWPTDRAWNLWEVDHHTQEMCVEMNKNGIWIDQKKRFELEVEYEHSVIQREKRIRELGDDLSPGSYDQIRHLLYEKWKLPIPPTMDAREFYTDTGLPGTDDNVLRAHMAGGLLSEKQSAFIRELRLFRREKNKILGTVLIPLRTREEDPKKGLVWGDGRVRSCWNAHVTSVGRLSSSGPNLQNIGNRKGQGRLKSVFAAPPGRIFVGADLDQAHLRITANYWKIPRLLECFEKNLDPHGLLCQDIFGKDYEHADGWGPEGFSVARKPPKGKAKSMRDVMKTFRYASIYWADPNTVWRVLTSTETDDAQLPYANMTSRQVRTFHRRWLKAEPEWLQAWQLMLNIFAAQGYIEEPVMGRRSGGLSDGKKNEVVNFPILAAESSLMRIAEIRIRDAFPYEFAGPGTGMIHQCHDSIAVEVPLPPGCDPLWKPKRGEPLPPTLEYWKNLVEECMTVRVPGWPVVLTSEADVGRTLKDV
jgi:uracil-DNA glycosylase